MGKFNFANLKKTAYYLKRNGLKSTLSAVAERFDDSYRPAYQWEPVPEEELKSQLKKSAAGFSKITFTILVPTYRTPEPYLREMITSVINQSYTRWELILADASGDDSVRCIADARHDDRIRYLRLPGNAGIAENTNKGLALATGDYVGLLDHDDVLAENALYEMADRIEKEKQKGIVLEMLYSDEDKCNGDRTEYYEPHFKEKYNLDLLLTNNYVCHFMVMKRDLMQRLMLRKEYDGAQDFDLVLRAAYELTGQEEKIAHISEVLYHWRCHTSSTAENPRSKLYAYEAGRRAVQDFVDKKGWDAVVEETEHMGFYRVVYRGNCFETRPELGAVGGPIIHGRRIVGGRMSESGEVFYRGLPVFYSGYMHRAVLGQEAEVLDIRNICVRPSCRRLFEEVVGVSYVSAKDSETFDASVLPGECDIVRTSIELARALKKKGFCEVYLPEIRKNV